MPASLSRRHLMARSTAAGFFVVAGQWLWLTPQEAEAKAFEPQILTRDQCKALASLADTLVPGAAAAGFAAYIDLQLQAGDASLLIGKYLGVDTTAQTGFYQSAADNLIALKNDELISGGVDGTLRRWKDGRPVGGPIQTGQGRVRDLVALNNGEVISGGAEGTLRR